MASGNPFGVFVCFPRPPTKVAKWLIHLALGFWLVSQPAKACIIAAPFEPGDVKIADVVVIGHVLNYRLAFTPRAKSQIKNLLANSRISEDTKSRLREIKGDYAKFEVHVEQVLKGTVFETFSVTWQNSTFALPERIEPAKYVIAARGTNTRLPPLRGPSGVVFPDPEPGVLAVLQAPCSGAFILELGSAPANAVLGELAK